MTKAWRPTEEDLEIFEFGDLVKISVELDRFDNKYGIILDRLISVSGEPYLRILNQFCDYGPLEEYSMDVSCFLKVSALERLALLR